MWLDYIFIFYSLHHNQWWTELEDLYISGTKSSDFQWPYLNQGRSNFHSSLCRCFIVHLLMQQKFPCVKLTGRSWWTWEMNCKTPTHRAPFAFPEFKIDFNSSTTEWHLPCSNVYVLTSSRAGEPCRFMWLFANSRIYDPPELLWPTRLWAHSFPPFCFELHFCFDSGERLPSLSQQHGSWNWKVDPLPLSLTCTHPVVACSWLLEVLAGSSCRWRILLWSLSPTSLYIVYLSRFQTCNNAKSKAPRRT